MDETTGAWYVHGVTSARLGRKARAFLASLFLTLLWVFPALAAYTPPPLVGHVVDVPGLLSGAERASLDRKLDQARKTRGYAVVVLVAGPLEGTPIEDVAYDTFNTWGVGEKGKDDGVLLVVAPHDRKIRIETGKGVGGALPDLAVSRINREIIGPGLAAGHNPGGRKSGGEGKGVGLRGRRII